MLEALIIEDQEDHEDQPVKDTQYEQEQRRSETLR